MRRSKPPTRPTQEDRRKQIEKHRARQKKQLSKKANSVLARIGRLASEQGKTTEWEGEFLGSVSERLQVFGSAFRDPEKGTPGAPLSILQGRKLREIERKMARKESRP